MPTNYPMIETKWVFRNKMDDLGNVVRNKARLVAQNFNQKKGIDFYKKIYSYKMLFLLYFIIP